MDRQIVYPGQILPETSLLQMAKDAMIGSAKLAAAMLGTSTIANGFAVTPTGPASLQVVVAPGEIYSLANIDSLAFSTLPADTTHSILKQGVMLDGVTLSCPAPTTTGQSINYLVQATYQDQDSAPVLLPYYNSANPALPYSGMGNNGLTQNTARKGVAIVQVKAGASAATGSQVTPAPDSGYVGLYVVTVAYGQTTITSTSIGQYAAAPLIPGGILPAIQSGAITYAADFGSANAYSATYTPAVTTLIDGMVLRFKAKNSNTAASTFSPNGITPKPIVSLSLGAIAASSILVNGHCSVCYSASIDSWILIYSLGAGISWSSISSAPTTLSGYGITDAYTKSQVDTALAAKPNGDNAITVGFVSGAKTAPYIQHTDTTVVRLANQATTLAGYGIADAYTKTLSDARYPLSDNALTIGFVSSDVTKPYIQSRTNNNVYRLQPLLGQATESAQGTVAIATQAATNTGTDDAGAITAKKLKFGFASLFAANGYLKFPDWLGGFIIQWGTVNVADDQMVDITLPISFPNSFFGAYATVQSNSAIAGANAASALAFKKSLSVVSIGYADTGSPQVRGVDFLCIGR